MGLMSPPGLPLFWQDPAPEQVGLQPDVAVQVTSAVARGEFPGLHALLILRHGRPAAECYFEGRDAVWGKDLGTVQHGAGKLHDLRSVTKSVVGLLYGIARSDGIVPPSSARLMGLYPQFDDGDPLRRRITIGHVLSMRLGLTWNEGTDYDSPANSEIQMEAAPDRIRYVLTRPMAEPPGSTWVYCGGATALLADLIARGSGLDLEAYARTKLFAPLGITDLDWVRGADGTPVGSSGLRLLPRDLARIGQMVLDRGRASWPQRGAAWLAGNILQAPGTCGKRPALWLSLVDRFPRRQRQGLGCGLWQWRTKADHHPKPEDGGGDPGRQLQCAGPVEDAAAPDDPHRDSVGHPLTQMGPPPLDEPLHRLDQPVAVFIRDHQ